MLAMVALVISALLIVASPTKNRAATKSPTLEFVEETFIDFGVPTHAGSGPHPTAESSDFSLTQGAIRWFAGSTVEYRVIGTEAVSGGNSAIEAAVATWDGFITTRNFSRNDSTGQTNPCTGSPSTIQWASIDGVGGALATASVCRNVATKEIVGFVITMDSDDSWAVGSVTGRFDVENVASHEVGHVAGLGHDNPPRSGCLTTYKLAAQGETQKRTPGLGDKLGMDVLYSTGNTTFGPGCGA